MTRRRQSQRLRLRILVGMETGVDLSIADDDHGEHEAEEGSADSNHAREADCLEHDIAEAGDLVGLDDFHYDWRAWRLHSFDCTAGLKGSFMVRGAVLAFALVALIVPAAAQQRDRASIPEKYKWDLTPIYPSNAAWRAAKEKLEADLPGIRQFRGTLGSSPAALADALERVTALRKTLYRIATYANLQADQDTRNARAPGNAAGSDAHWRIVRH